ncbi:MAG: YraN family protein [Nannocystaceae bacterium]
MNARSTPDARSTRERGRAAEDLAARFLEVRGLVVLERNVTVGGVELDLVAMAPASAEDPADTVVFVEVRSRDDDGAGSPIETVDHRKRARLRRGAIAWLVARDLWERVAVRFDVIGVSGALAGGDRENDEAPRIDWIPGAFDGDEPGV